MVDVTKMVFRILPKILCVGSDDSRDWYSKAEKTMRMRARVFAKPACSRSRSQEAPEYTIEPRGGETLRKFVQFFFTFYFR